MLLSEEEWFAAIEKVRPLHGETVSAHTLEHISKAIEAAILAKLASAELPTTVWVDVPHFTYTVSQLQQAHAQGFAAGAAAQLAEEPVGYFTFKGASQIWEETTKSSGTPLYTRREA